jgi:hypothetical protein
MISQDVKWITCNLDNIASRKTCELAGARLVEIVDLSEDTDMYRKGERQKCRYRIDVQERSSPGGPSDNSPPFCCPLADPIAQVHY